MIPLYRNYLFTSLAACILFIFSGCTLSDAANCISDSECPPHQRCLSGGGLIFRDAVCVDQEASQEPLDVGPDAPQDSQDTDIGDDTDDASQCDPGLILCDDVCVDPESEDFCGSCNNRCIGGQTCSDGQCSCPTDETFCQGQCVNIDADLNNCGGCGVQCGPDELCLSGSCTLSCEAPLDLCSDQCVDTTADPDHCGQCDAECGAHEVCTDGECQCLDDTLARCEDSQGALTCVDLDTDPHNCGGCGSDDDAFICPSGLCIDGQCSPCDPTRAPFGGGSGASDDPYLICSPIQFNRIRNALDAHFELVTDIDLAAHPNFTPIGTHTDPFTGVLDGQGLSIKNLTIHKEDDDHLGLFTALNGTVTDLRLQSLAIKGQNNVGALAGEAQSSTKITGVHLLNATITGQNNVGGLIGYNVGELTTSRVTGDSRIYGESNIGGLVGVNAFSSSSSAAGSITQSFATAQVTATGDNIGGLAGRNHGELEDSYVISEMSGQRRIGGLVGYHSHQSSTPSRITNCYAIAHIDAIELLGGLVGDIQEIDSPQPPAPIIQQSFYLQDVDCPTCDNGFGTPLSEAELAEPLTFSDWDLTDIWEHHGERPTLIWED